MQAVAVAGSICTAGEGASSLTGGLLTAAFGFRTAYLIAACGMVAGGAAAYYHLPSDAELAAGCADAPEPAAVAAPGADAQSDGGKARRGSGALLDESMAGSTGGDTRPSLGLEMKRRSGRRGTDGAAGIDEAPGGAPVEGSGEEAA